MSCLAPHCRPSAIVFALLILIVALLSVLAWKVEQVFNPSMSVLGAAHAAAPAASSARLAADYGKLPISFEMNQGQTDKSVQFLARGAGYTLFLTPGEAVLSLHAPHAIADKPGDRAFRGTLRPSPRQLPSTTPASTVRLQLLGANTKAEASGVDPLPGKSNYFIGNDPAKWHTDVPTYAKVRYSNVYPGIDLLYYGNQEGRLEHDFVLAPGADPNAIAIGLRDSDGAVPDGDGGLTLHTKTGDLTLRSPLAYQLISGQRKTIPATYLLANNQIKFQLGSYDRNAALVIDPVLQYSAVFGGFSNDGFADNPQAIAVDGSGSTYVTGQTDSLNFPTVNPIQADWCCEVAAFVSKINAAGTALLYSTYLGLDSAGTGIKVDNAGRAYVVGDTREGLPLKNAFQSTFGGAQDAFLTVLSPAGDSLVYSTYIGGPSTDSAYAIALDASGNAYVAGFSGGDGFPTLHSIQPQDSAGIFVAKYNNTGGLQYSSVVGPTDSYLSWGAIAVDTSGSAYITGFTHFSQIPIIKPAFQYTCAQSGCGFVAKLSPSGDKLAYSTYFPAPPIGIAVDSSRNAYIAGTAGLGFPVTKTAFQKAYGSGASDGFVAKLNSSGSGLVWSTYLGGSGMDAITGLALDQYRQVYVTGYTNSPNFPLKAPVQAYTGKLQYFVATLSGDLGSIVYYSTYFGTSADDYYSNYHPRASLALDRALNVYVTGTTSGGVQSTPGALSTGTPGNPGGQGDVFVSKLVIAADMGLALSSSPVTAVHGSNLTYYLIAQNNGPDWAAYLKLYDLIPPGTTFVSFDAGGGTCTAPTVGDTGYLTCTLPRLDKGVAWQVKLVVKVNSPTGGYIVNQAHVRSNMQDLVWQNNYASLTTGVSVFAGAANPVPYVSSPLVPDVVAPGAAAFTLRVNGEGFVPESLVKWNGSTRATQFLSGGKLTASIPASDVAKAGTASVIVVNPGPGGGGSVPVSFSIIRPVTSVSLKRTDYEGGQTPTGALLADLNGDHNLDLVLANSTFGNTVSVFLGSGNGKFKPRLSYQVGDWPNSPNVGDFNGDGIPDLAVANYSNDTISVLLGKGDGTFKAQATYPVGSSPGSFSTLAVGDFNRDGRLDLAVSNCRCFNPGPSTISVLLGNGDGTFQSQIEFAAGSTPVGVVTGDFNRDGKLDLAAINYPDNKLSVLLGNGDGTFQNYVQYPVGLNPYGIEVADLNGDGILDLVTNNYNGNSVSVLLGKGDGTFKPQRQYATGGNPISGTVADLNGDGKPDLLISSLVANSVSVLFGRGDGTFSDHVQYAQSSPTGSVAAGDLNGDGRVDLVTTSNQSDAAARVSVFLQTGP
jgi:uncharacterized repeat protein (TIGR01451 family)